MSYKICPACALRHTRETRVCPTLNVHIGVRRGPINDGFAKAVLAARIRDAK